MAGKTCFFIAPIGDRDSAARKRSDQVLRHLVRFAAEPLGFQAMRADELDDEGLITNQVIDRLVSGDLVVADLTGRNPNVFYELAVRHAARKPVVHLIQHGEAIPFDVANMRAVPYALDDPDLLTEAQGELRRKIEAAVTAERPAANPITAALDLQALRASDEPEKEALGAVLAAIDDLRGEVRGIKNRLGTRGSPLTPIDGVPSVGDGVVHDAFGSGVVTGTEPSGIITIKFADGTHPR